VLVISSAYSDSNAAFSDCSTLYIYIYIYIYIYRVRERERERERFHEVTELFMLVVFDMYLSGK